MKQLLIWFVTLAAFTIQATAQEQEQKKEEGFQFTVVKENPITSVKNQSSTGTCWSFSSLGFMESELLRMGKGEYDLSEMFVVSRTYTDKADKYIRLDGALNFAQGGGFDDYLYVIRKYGMVPNQVMPGLNYGEDVHRHGELTAVLTGIVEAVKKNPNRKLSTAWKNAFQGALDAYLGEIPETFEYKGTTYTPISFAASLGFNPDDYVNITSFTHHPFYTQFALEIPDNWLWGTSYNVPMEEMMSVIDHAIMEGYTVLWASDVSEQGFGRNGIAMYPTTDPKEMIGSDQARWLEMSATERSNAFRNLKAPVAEIKAITQEMRQEAYDNKQTTDDHGMQIYGIAKDQNGTKYYMVKNSWGEDAGNYKGLWYVTEKFVQYKTMDIQVHKNAIPREIKKKLNL
ncbi:MAG TPA: C1 family peptidase [Bacteroidales bacterium]|nr:MAG: Aminopeptidase E [Bacteroidetes bacterium ADurb.Bin139]HOR10889.1 C1 family peptidase [Bacteroidales bacterium]HOZ19018.1 C1 family peptidase [Bacteroidales bacterium]HPB77860.1 C1 family peptidase [Bacteroidales bacterium]HPK38420.1 C1 family peptidase [Bacteroidales bacterium]